MSYTFDELAAWWDENAGSGSGAGTLQANGTLVRTQESGVTGYMPFVVTKMTKPLFGSLQAFGYEQFSDRTTSLTQKDPDTNSPFSYEYSQNFDARNLTLPGGIVSVDLANFEIRNLGGNRCEVILTFEKWGAIPPFTIELMPSMKVYSGIGQGIGPSAVAVYLLSIQSVGMVQIN